MTRFSKVTAEIYQHPGPKPRHPAAVMDTEGWDQYHEEMRKWEGAILMWGFQDMRIESARKRERARLENVAKFGLDAQATRERVLARAGSWEEYAVILGLIPLE